MRRTSTAMIVLILVSTLAACGASAPTSPPLPQPQPTLTTTSAPTQVTTQKVTTCDRAREAFLTGTTKEQTAALKALRADKSAPATAREYADYWLVRDKTDKTLRELDKGIIQSVCS